MRKKKKQVAEFGIIKCRKTVRCLLCWEKNGGSSMAGILIIFIFIIISKSVIVMKAEGI